MVKPPSPAAEHQEADLLARTTLVKPWMVQAVVSSLPYLADKATIRRTLEECRGSVNDAVSKLLDVEDCGSASSTQGSSSIEREPDSDDDFLAGPNKKQDRRAGRNTRHHMHTTFDRTRLAPITPSLDADTSQDSSGSFESDVFSIASDVQSQPQESPPTDIDVIVVNTDTEDSKGLGRIKLNPPKPPQQDTYSKTIRGHGPKPGPKRITARDRKDMKKQAQKAARKQRQQADLRNNTAVVSAKDKAGMALRSGGSTDTPLIESGFRTLII